MEPGRYQPKSLYEQALTQTFWYMRQGMIRHESPDNNSYEGQPLPPTIHDDLVYKKRLRDAIPQCARTLCAH